MFAANQIVFFLFGRFLLRYPKLDCQKCLTTTKLQRECLIVILTPCALEQQN